MVTQSIKDTVPHYCNWLVFNQWLTSKWDSPQEFLWNPHCIQNEVVRKRSSCWNILKSLKDMEKNSKVFLGCKWFVIIKNIFWKHNMPYFEWLHIWQFPGYSELEKHLARSSKLHFLSADHTQQGNVTLNMLTLWRRSDIYGSIFALLRTTSLKLCCFVRATPALLLHQENSISQPPEQIADLCNK